MGERFFPLTNPTKSKRKKTPTRKQEKFIQNWNQTRKIQKKKSYLYKKSNVKIIGLWFLTLFVTNSSASSNYILTLVYSKVKAPDWRE